MALDFWPSTLARVTSQNSLFLLFIFSTIFMPITIFLCNTIKYCHLHTNILVILNRLQFIVVIIELVTLEQLYLAVTLLVLVQQFLIFICIVTHVTLISAVYEYVGVPLAEWNICKWSYICNTFCWIIEVVIFFGSQLLIAQLEFRCGWYALLTSYFVVSSFISKTTLLLSMLNSFALFWFSLMRFSNFWMLLLNFFKEFST